MVFNKFLNAGDCSFRLIFICGCYGDNGRALRHKTRASSVLLFSPFMYSLFRPPLNIDINGYYGSSGVLLRFLLILKIVHRKSQDFKYQISRSKNQISGTVIAMYIFMQKSRAMYIFMCLQLSCYIASICACTRTYDYTKYHILWMPVYYNVSDDRIFVVSETTNSKSWIRRHFL